jgi:hypothetical protein
VNQLLDALSQREDRSGDEHAKCCDEGPEIRLSPVPEGVLGIGTAATPELSHEEEEIVGGVSQ